MRLALWLEVALLVLCAGCRAGGAARSARLPEPHDLATWLATAVFVLGLWWIALKILRG
jgi:hypothetical protein